VIADVAAGAAELFLGDGEAARDRLINAEVIAREAGDVVARDLVAATVHSVLDGEARTGGDHLGPGWVQVIESLAAATSATVAG
jgi:hypothetical protein